MDHFASVFDTAGDDVEAEARERIHTMATQQATSTCWPFLSLAQSPTEFEHRLALIEDRLESIASEHGVSCEEITAPLREGFKAVLAAKSQDPGGGYHRHDCDEGCKGCECSCHSKKEAGLDPKAASGLKCADCGHANPQHEEGGPCPCGCVAFNPRGKRSSLVTADRNTPWQTAHNGNPGQRKGDDGLYYDKDGDPYSDECSNGYGVGCDGGECSCPCHGPNAPMFRTNDDVSKWHGLGEPWDDGNHQDPLTGEYHTGSLKQASEFKGWEGEEERRPDEDEGQRFGCPDCHGTPMWFDMEKGIQTCQGACKGSGVVHRKRKADSTGGYSYHDFDFSPAPKTAAIADQRLAVIKRALSEGVNPLEWLEGDAPGPVPTHHETTQVFEGTNPVALDQALGEGAAKEAVWNPRPDNDVFKHLENHQCEDDGSGKCKTCAQDIPADLRDKTAAREPDPFA